MKGKRIKIKANVEEHHLMMLFQALSVQLNHLLEMEASSLYSKLYIYIYICYISCAQGAHVVFIKFLLVSIHSLFDLGFILRCLLSRHKVFILDMCPKYPPSITDIKSSIFLPYSYRRGPRGQPPCRLQDRRSPLR